jgi:hypothetical protein
MDSSNRSEVKLVPIVARYFSIEEGIKVKLLHFDEVSGESAEILAQHLLQCVKKYKLEEKLVCYTADNTNSNFGGVKRKGEEHVFRKVQSDLDMPILEIGCSAHIVQKSVQTACDSLPLDTEDTVIKIYKYFHIYTVRATKLKQFCEFVETDYKKILSHSSTRFLSLLPAIERILAIFDGLKSFFLFCDKWPKLLFDFFYSFPKSKVAGL